MSSAQKIGEKISVEQHFICEEYSLYHADTTVYIQGRVINSYDKKKLQKTPKTDPH